MSENETSEAGQVGHVTPVIHAAEEARTAPIEIIKRISEIAAARGESIRIRTSISLWDFNEQYYTPWRGQNWRVDARNAEEAEQVRQVLELAFDLVAQRGPRNAREALQQMTSYDAAPVAGPETQHVPAQDAESQHHRRASDSRASDSAA